MWARAHSANESAKEKADAAVKLKIMHSRTRLKNNVSPPPCYSETCILQEEENLLDKLLGSQASPFDDLLRALITRRGQDILRT